MAPAPFIHYLIVMVYDRGLQLYMPCAYSLRTSKKSEMITCYFHLKQALHSKLKNLYPNQPKIYDL
ncbi:hypothetical protein MXB_1334 [Myxobolus squamalis]|nr:hypothetical protein MXB_1334 [Myxobolus squamalis]